MPAVTDQQLIDAGFDADTFGLFVNSAQPTIITRTGASYPSLAALIAQIQATSGVSSQTVQLPPVTVAFANNATFNLALGDTFSLTLIGDCFSPNFVNPVDGKEYSVYVRQDQTGGHAFTPPASFIGMQPISTANGNNGSASVAMIKVKYDAVSAKYYAISPLVYG